MKDEIFGLEFTYKNHKLGKLRMLNSEQMDLINLSCANSEMMFVLCGKCNTHMIHHDEGYYICSICGVKVYESTALRKIEKENDKWLEQVNNIEVPVGCSACGGPYPDCITGCKVFDE